MKRKDLAEWEREYGGTTAEGVAKRVINQYNPGDELLRISTRGPDTDSPLPTALMLDSNTGDQVESRDSAVLRDISKQNCAFDFSFLISAFRFSLNFRFLLFSFVLFFDIYFMFWI